MAYQRFCDIHIASDTQYHFVSEIVDYCKYQVELKGLNVVNGKALMVLNYISDWQQAVFALLSEFPQGQVIFRNAGVDMARKIVELCALRAEKFPNAADKIRNAVPGAPGKFLNRAQTADPTDNAFKGLLIEAKKLDSGEAYSIGKVGATGNQKIVFDPARDFADLDDKIGYLAFSIPMSEIAQAVENAGIGKMIKWLTAQSSKLRITSHGDGEGNFQMGSSNESMSADCVAKWLKANQLQTRGELKTISVNICMAAKCNLTPAVLKNGQYTPAEGSAVALLAGKLRELGITGVKVTGANEVVDAKEKPSPYTRTAVGDLLVKNAQSFRQIDVPGTLKFDTGAMVMTLPSGWSVTHVSMEDSRLCAIKYPAAWTVTTKASREKATQFDGSVREFSIASGDYVFEDPTSKTLISFLGGQ